MTEQNPSPPRNDDAASALVASRLDEIAEQFHLLYVDSLPSGHGRVVHDWAELSEADRESNRASARAVVGQLHSMGLTVADAVDPSPVAVDLDAQVVEAAARAEHDRWMDFKWSQGWVLGPEHDGSALPPTHPDLVPWEKLSEAARDKDRVRIAQLPRVLAAVGLAVVPIANVSE